LDGKTLEGEQIVKEGMIRLGYIDEAVKSDGETLPVRIVPPIAVVSEFHE
jgi:hypothetical protein